MREIDVNRVEDAVCRMVQQINYEYPADIEQDMKRWAAAETHPIARSHWTCCWKMLTLPEKSTSPSVRTPAWPSSS